MKIFSATLLLVLMTASSALYAQDAHYWTNQYGNQARLLSGAVVGSANDGSTVYYNPGRLALLENPEFLVAGKVYEMSWVSFEDESGRDRALRSNKLNRTPSLLAGMLPFSEPQGSRWAFSFLTRHSFRLSLTQNAGLSPAAFPDVESLVTDLEFDSDMNEYWAGLTWARALSDQVGIGVTGFFTIRNQNTRKLFLLQAQGLQGIGVALQKQTFDLLQLGLLAKAGIGADLDPWSLGLTITTPTLRLWGDGSVIYNETLSQAGADGIDWMIHTHQDGLKADFQSPLSVAAGAGYTWNRTRFHLTAEFFAPISRYTVLDPQAIALPDTSAVRNVSVSDERKAVVNLALGIEQQISKRMNLYASYRTDRNALADDGANQTQISTWDLNHIAAGVSFSTESTDITLGLVYASGKDTQREIIELVPVQDAVQQAIETQKITASYRRMTAIIGFSLLY